DRPAAGPLFEAHVAVRRGEQREVAAQADVLARVEPSAALAHQDRPGRNPLSGEALDAPHLWLAVPAVAGAADALLVCHGFSAPPPALPADLDPRDPDGRVPLPVSAPPPVVLPSLELHHDDLGGLANPHDRPGAAGPAQARRLDDWAVVVPQVGDLRELDGLALPGAQPLDTDHVALADPVLLAARPNHGLHDAASPGMSPDGMN